MTTPTTTPPVRSSAVVRLHAERCPRCKATAIRLWDVEIVWPGDNSDNSTKATRYGCDKCDIAWTGKRPNDQAQRPGAKT